MQKKKSVIIQISLLVLIQWLSIAVIVINALALDASKDVDGGLMMALESGIQNYITLIMGAASLIAVSIVLCFYLQMFFRLLGNHPISPLRKVLGTEVVLSIIIIALWTSATSLITAHFYQSSSCKKINTLIENKDSNQLSANACNLADAMIVIAFITIVLWFITLVVSIYSLLKLSNSNETAFFSMVTPSIIHPYENVSKLQILSRPCSALITNNRFLNHESSLPSTATLTRPENVVISEPGMNDSSPYETVPNSNPAFPPLPAVEPDNEKERSQDTLQEMNTSAESEKVLQPVSAFTTKHQTEYDFDFQFEPLQIDLILPSTSELIGSKNKQQRNNHY